MIDQNTGTQLIKELDFYPLVTFPANTRVGRDLQTLETTKVVIYLQPYTDRNHTDTMDDGRFT